jgi:peptidyl-prolyl cis-trans isomerase D
MLAAFRSFAQSTVAKVFLSVLGLTFIMWGAGSQIAPHLSTAVVSVAGRPDITPDQFKRYFDRAVSQAERSHPGQSITTQEAVDQGFDQQILKEVSQSEAFGAFLQKLGLNPAPRLVAARIRSNSAFFDQLGEFNKQTYEEVLRTNRMTVPEFEQATTDQIAEEHLEAGLAAGLVAPNTYGAVLASYAMDNRSFTYFVVDPRAMPPPTPPTDAQLQTFYNQNSAQLMRPEMRMLSVVSLSAQALAPSMPEDMADEQKRYQFRKDSLSTPEKRTFEQFATHDAATAQKIAAALKAGQTPAAVGKALGVAPQAQTDTPKSAVADPAAADAAFQPTAAGQVAGPVPSGLEGFVVIKVDKITPAATPSFESLHDKLAAESKLDAARQKVYGLYSKYEGAHDGGSNLADSAKAAGVAPTPIGPITADGKDANGQAVPGLSPQLLHQAFALSAGGESDMEDEGNGEYFAVRVDKVMPPAPPPLAEIKTKLAAFMMQQDLLKAMQAKADALAAAVKKGESLDAAAASVHSATQHLANFPRGALEQNRGISQELGGKLFAAKAGDIVTGPVAGQQGIPAIMVAHVDGASPGDPTLVARQALTARQSNASSIFQDIMDAAGAYATAKMKPKADAARADAALGVNPQSGAKPAGPAS